MLYNAHTNCCGNVSTPSKGARQCSTGVAPHIVARPSSAAFRCPPSYSFDGGCCSKTGAAAAPAAPAVIAVAPKKAPTTRKTKKTTATGEPKPKRAMTGYTLFYKEHFAGERRGDEAVKEVAMRLGPKWKALSEAARQEYKNRATGGAGAAVQRKVAAKKTSAPRKKKATAAKRRA